MNDLSPAADAVLDAYMNNCGWLDGPLEKDYRCAAAVLRAAADQVVPPFTTRPSTRTGLVKLNIRNRLQSLADELEGRDATTI